VGEVEIPPLLRDFQARGESPALGLFHGAASSTVLFTHRFCYRALFPKFLYRANFCMYVSHYKSIWCGYTGALTNCDGTYNGANGCQVHNNAGRFGAFPGIGTNGTVLAAQN